MMKLGSTTINKVMLGETEIKLIYLGDTIIHDTRTPAPSGSAWSLTGAAYADKSLYIGSLESAATDITFRPTGATMYVAGGDTNRIRQYTLGTAWDIETGSYANKMLNTSAHVTRSTGVRLSSDGSVAFVVDGKLTAVHQYDIGTAWDISTGTHDDSIDLSTDAPGAAYIDFSADGETMYVLSGSTRTIKQFDLSSAWDATSATYSGRSFWVGGQDNFPRSFFIGNSGAKLFLVGSTNDRAYEYSMTGGNINTASFVQHFSVAQDNTPIGIGFKADGTVMYASGIQFDRVRQYSLT